MGREDSADLDSPAARTLGDMGLWDCADTKHLFLAANYLPSSPILVISKNVNQSGHVPNVKTVVPGYFPGN